MEASKGGKAQRRQWHKRDAIKHHEWALPILTGGAMHDRIEQLVFESDFSVSVLGRGAVYVLIDNSTPHNAELLAYATSRQFAWCGVLGMKHGVPRVECDPHPDSAITMAHAALGFCSAYAERLRHSDKGDSVGWLRSLHALPDMRGCGHA